MSQRNVNIVVIAAAIILSIAILANSMSKPVGRDEQMYCTGGVLMGQGKMIYRDFSYAAQLPYHPLLLSAVYRILPTRHYLLAGRLISTACDILVLVCILGIYRRIFGKLGTAGGLLGLGGAVLYVFNPLVDYANGYAWNHDVVIACVAAAFWLYISLDWGGKPQRLRIFAVGALLTFAACMRITTFLVELLFLAFLFARPADSLRKRCRRLAPLLGGAAIMLVWPLWVIAQAPEASYLNIVKIPRIYGQWLIEIGRVFDKFELTAACLTTPGYLALIGVAVYLCFAVLVSRRKLKIADGGHWLLACLLSAAFFLIAFIPPTMWHQYLAVPVPFLVISLAYPLRYLRHLDRHFKAACVVLGIGAFAALLAHSTVLKRIPLALVPEEWIPVSKRRVFLEIASELPKGGRVLTLAPLAALEAGYDIYDELSAGAIIYRIADLLSPRERSITNTVGPEGLSQMVESSPPSGVLVGVEEARYEKPLKAIVPPAWGTEVLPDGSVLHFRP